jgi:hypothetical protein
MQWLRYLGEYVDFSRATKAGRCAIALGIMSGLLLGLATSVQAMPAWAVWASIVLSAICSWLAQFEIWRKERFAWLERRRAAVAPPDRRNSHEPPVAATISTIVDRLPQLVGSFSVERVIRGGGRLRQDREDEGDPAHIVLCCEGTNVGGERCIPRKAVIYVERSGRPEMSWEVRLDTVNGSCDGSTKIGIQPQARFTCGLHTTVPGYSFADLTDSVVALCIQDNVGRKHRDFTRETGGEAQRTVGSFAGKQ